MIFDFWTGFGAMFAPKQRFHNCFALCFGFVALGNTLCSSL